MAPAHRSRDDLPNRSIRGKSHRDPLCRRLAAEYRRDGVIDDLDLSGVQPPFAMSHRAES
jgi:hypothetical protein